MVSWFGIGGLGRLLFDTPFAFSNSTVFTVLYMLCTLGPDKVPRAFFSFFFFSGYRQNRTLSLLRHSA